MEAGMTGRKRIFPLVTGWLKQRETTLICLVFAVAALVQGLFYAFSVPFSQTPDELTHYELIEAEFGTSGYTQEMIDGVYLPAGLQALPFNYDAKVNTAALDAVSRTLFSKPLTLGSFRPGISALRHLPAGIGFYLGIAMDLPMLWCACLAEIFSVLFYVFMGCAALKLAPVKKDIFAFCLLMPQTLQLVSSVNYDSVLIPCSFFLSAYILNLYYTGSIVRWRNLFLILFLTFVVTLIKPPYAMIALALFIIPLKQFRLKIGRKFDLALFLRKYWYAAVLLFLAAAGAGIYLFRDNPFLKTILADVLSLPQFAGLLFRTYRALGTEHVIQLVGQFGWLDSSVSSMFIFVFLMMAVYLNSTTLEVTERKLSVPRRIWLAAVFVFAFVLTEIAMQCWSYGYLNWDTGADLSAFRDYIGYLPNILGFQGRYWIPCLPLLLVGLSGPAQRTSRKWYWLVQIGFYAVSFLSVMQILSLRYFG